MGRKSTGTVRFLRDEDGAPRWHARWTLADSRRSKWTPIDPKIPVDDEARAKACAAKLALRVLAASAGKGVVETVEQYAARWLDDRDGRVNSIRDDRGRMRDHVLPVLGPLNVRAFGRDDVERLRDELDTKIKDGELSWKTAANVWTLFTSLCDSMANAKKRELRIRENNPCRDVKPPDRGSNKAKQYLYPSEFLKFVACGGVPLTVRRAVAIAIYTFTRDGELQALR